MDATNGFIVLFLLVIAWFFYKKFAKVKGLTELNHTVFAEKLKETKPHMLIDVREPQEFKSGHIAGAKNIPLSQLDQRLSEIPKDKALFLYCQSGMRSKQAAAKLMRSGYGSLHHLQGGFMAWNGKRMS
ncbi:rhodanese-like domain-containing protein [Paenibacillus sp. 1001270B_150601_E10]|uniref:rhodanese-like domain-containing protein n=1 Tax=Paenibacillus sp. 1001270B_150601_E10 TaxID=2787079 RepID=UPI00189F9908|nr:rhodanese-like domain-containing protein [Paenibacillus sp. 1001270B_150601_E10]